MKTLASASLPPVLAPLLALFIAGTAFAAWATLSPRGVAGPLAPLQPPFDLPDPDSTATLLHRAGLTPQSMAAAGCTLEQVNRILDLMRVQAARPGFVDDLEAATAALNERLNQHVQPVAPGIANPDAPPIPVPARDTATVTERREAVDALLDEAFTFATTAIANSSQQTLLASIRDNSRWSAIPAPYLVVARTPADNLRLRQALTATAQSTRDRRIQPGAARAIIEHADQAPLVTAARTASEDNLAAIQTLWNQRVEAP